MVQADPKKVRDRPIFRTDLQIRTTFGLGWVGGFTETGCSDFKGNEKSVHPEIPYTYEISETYETPETYETSETYETKSSSLDNTQSVRNIGRSLTGVI